MNGLNLFSYNGVMTTGLRKPVVVAGNTAGSILYQALTGEGPAGQMPPGGKVPIESIQAVADWINQGAINN